MHVGIFAMGCISTRPRDNFYFFRLHQHLGFLGYDRKFEVL
jgi:hypothetical protein